jgi:hypothetical protein
MIEQSTDGLLFFRGARVLYACSAYNFTRTGARIHSGTLGPVPMEFYVTFDTFRTIAKCRLLWRHQDRLGVAFERWVQVRGRAAGSDSDPA